MRFDDAWARCRTCASTEIKVFLKRRIGNAGGANSPVRLSISCRRHSQEQNGLPRHPLQWISHKKDSKLLKRAVAKYGKENFTLDIIEEGVVAVD